jgi:hypothetical protein
MIKKTPWWRIFIKLLLIVCFFCMSTYSYPTWNERFTFFNGAINAFLLASAYEYIDRER